MLELSERGCASGTAAASAIAWRTASAIKYTFGGFAGQHCLCTM